jgi:hypothetical protein
MIEPDTVVRRSERATFRKLEDGSGVILHLDTTQYHGVNEVGVAIWELTEAPRSFADLVEGLHRQLEDPPAHLEVDVEDFLRALQERDLVSLSSGEPAAGEPGSVSTS